MISAKEARELSEPSAQEIVNDVEPAIREAIASGDRTVHLHGDFWARAGYSRTKKYLEAEKILKDLGYKVSFYYKEHSMAVDMYTVVEW